MALDVEVGAASWDGLFGAAEVLVCLFSAGVCGVSARGVFL